MDTCALARKDNQGRAPIICGAMVEVLQVVGMANNMLLF